MLRRHTNSPQVIFSVYLSSYGNTCIVYHVSLTIDVMSENNLEKCSYYSRSYVHISRYLPLDSRICVSSSAGSGLDILTMLCKQSTLAYIKHKYKSRRFVFITASSTLEDLS